MTHYIWKYKVLSNSENFTFCHKKSVASFLTWPWGKPAITCKESNSWRLKLKVKTDLENVFHNNYFMWKTTASQRKWFGTFIMSRCWTFLGSDWDREKVAAYNCSAEVLLHFVKDHQVRIEMGKIKMNFLLIIRYIWVRFFFTTVWKRNLNPFCDNDSHTESCCIYLLSMAVHYYSYLYNY